MGKKQQIIQQTIYQTLHQTVHQNKHQNKQQNRGIKRLTMVLLLVAVFIYPWGDFVVAQVISPPSDAEAEEKLTQISEEEKGIIEKLFVLSSEIEFLTTQIEALNVSMDDVRTDINGKMALIQVEEKRFVNLRDNLGQVLRFQQRSGAASGVEIILKSKNLNDFIDRVNLLRDLSKNIDTLMNETEASKDRLLREKSELDALLVSLEEQETLLKQSVLDKTQAKADLEAYLESLASEKSHYEDYLASIDTLWNSLKPLFAETLERFAEIIETGDMPGDTIEINISLFNTRGTLREDKFNQILSGKEDLPEMTFDFKEGAIDLEFPSHRVLLHGNFELLNSQTIQYVVTGGEFFDLPMSESAIKDLFSEGDLVFSLKSIMGKNTIKKIEVFEDRIELQVSIGLF